ncbi:MAG TPA: hypothetical protein VGN98_09235 [Tianweitania sediminis]|jgi:ATP-dependent DNA ligase|nr:hypothetical protein [Tianweitania sediminis]
MVQYVSRPGWLEFIAPQLPSLVAKPREGAEWIHEIKYDGYRTQLIVQDGACRAFTRNGHDWSAKYRRICSEALQLGVQDAILDGEVIILGETGHPDFKALRHAIVAHQERLVFVAFDLLHLDGHDLGRMHLVERRALLHDLVPDGAPSSSAIATRAMPRPFSRRSIGWAWKARCPSAPTADIAPAHHATG